MKRYLLTIIAATVIYMPAIALEMDTAASKTDTASVAATTDIHMPAIAQEKDAAASKTDASSFKFSAITDMQFEKQLYDEFSSSSTNRISTGGVVTNYRQAADEFWMRVALKGSYQSKYLESVFNLRFYPYWLMRRDYTKENNISGAGGADLARYLEVWELNQAYFKVFKEYLPQENLTFKPHFKIGRDGLQNSCSQLFGNYLDQPAGGYGDSRFTNVAGPFKNRKIFANQLELGFAFNVFDKVGGTTSLIIMGGNLNNTTFYGTAATQFNQIEDSKLTAGFFRAYQDLYFLNKRIHAGAGVRNYTSIHDLAGEAGHFVRCRYLTAQCALDAVIVKDVKFYTEMAVQEMDTTASTTGVVRPINVGITIPTFGVLDTLALEFENVANTFFSDQSMRDAVVRSPTRAFGWGVVFEKRYLNKFVIDWGLYSGNPTGDMKTTLRLTGMLN
jgi:hypothetical protein